MPPEIGGKRGGSDPTIPVAVFSVSDDGSLTAVSTRTTASIADDVLTQAGEALADKPEGSGTLDSLGLFYEKRDAGGTTYLAFVDLSAASGWQTLALTLAGVGVAALAAFFVISVFFSRWALRPVDRAWRQQRQFVADASHDLKTPSPSSSRTRPSCSSTPSAASPAKASGSRARSTRPGRCRGSWATCCCSHRLTRAVRSPLWSRSTLPTS